MQVICIVNNKTILWNQNITSIGGKAFYGCSLNMVISLNTTPPVISHNTFNNSTYNEATLLVPIDCITVYDCSNWTYFEKMEEIDVSSINNTLIDNESGGCIYNLKGTKVDGNNYGKGIYIKNGKKVIIK